MYHEENSSCDLHHPQHAAIKLHLIKKSHQLIIPFEKSHDLEKAHDSHQAVQSGHADQPNQPIALKLSRIIIKYLLPIDKLEGDAGSYIEHEP
jgi:hypothetical protein